MTTIVVSFCNHADFTLNTSADVVWVSKCGVPHAYHLHTIEFGSCRPHPHVDYIVRSYNHLSPKIIFLKDSMHRGVTDPVFRLPYLSIKELEQSNRRFSCRMQHSRWHDRTTLSRFALKRYQKKYDHQKGTREIQERIQKFERLV